MSTVRRQREGMLLGEQDPLYLALAEARDRCCDEVGYEDNDGDFISPRKPRCPVRDKCRRLWHAVEDSNTHNLSMTGYRQLSQKFYTLKLERDRLLVKRGEAPLSAHKPA